MFSVFPLFFTLIEITSLYGQIWRTVSTGAEWRIKYPGSRGEERCVSDSEDGDYGLAELIIEVFLPDTLYKIETFCQRNCKKSYF